MPGPARRGCHCRLHGLCGSQSHPGRLAPTPEESDFTSIQERIRAWQNEMMTTASVPGESNQNSWISLCTEICKLEIAHFQRYSRTLPSNPSSASWLCPIQSDSQRRGILQMTAADYFDLVDQSGRILRSDKRGAIDADLAPILLRIGANPRSLDSIPFPASDPNSVSPPDCFPVCAFRRSAWQTLAHWRSCRSSCLSDSPPHSAGVRVSSICPSSTKIQGIRISPRTLPAIVIFD